MAVSLKPAPCPLCGKPPHPDHAPFCSRGCKDRDLMQWLGEGYRIPVRETGVDSTETPD